MKKYREIDNKVQSGKERKETHKQEKFTKEIADKKNENEKRHTRVVVALNGKERDNALQQKEKEPEWSLLTMLDIDWGIEKE